MSSKGKISGAVAALRKVAEDIRRIEAEARSALYERDDSAVHRKKLEEKAILLTDLHEAVEPFLDGMDGEARADIEEGVNDFSHRAGQALDLSSIFYMSVLLYPDEYQDGDRNDLEEFIDDIRNRYLPQ